LGLCLQSLKNQSFRDFEILIADDGSKEETRILIQKYIQEFPIKITHLWHEDIGCRKTIIGNRAINSANGQYLIFLDGDCVVQPDYLQRHLSLAQKGYLVTGSRILLNQKFTQEILTEGYIDFSRLQKNSFFLRIQGSINKFLPLFIKFGNGKWRNYKKFFWRRIKGCNMACWREDALAIKGFDETLIGWGHEDADFIFRLENKGIIRKSGSWSTEVIHLFHKVRDQSNNDESTKRILEKVRLMRARQFQ
jgi:glycosyltransferase involved in cell wall biosynthesis